LHEIGVVLEGPGFVVVIIFVEGGDSGGHGFPIFRWHVIAKGLDQNHHDEWAHRLCELPNQPWKRPRKEEELYDLLKDPNEQRNLAADPATVDELRKMRKLLKQHMEKTKDPYLGKPFTHDYDPKLYEKHKAGDT